MADRPWQDPGTLYELRFEKAMSTADMAAELGCSPKSIHTWLNRHDLGGDLPSSVRYLLANPPATAEQLPVKEPGQIGSRELGLARMHLPGGHRGGRAVYYLRGVHDPEDVVLAWLAANPEFSRRSSHRAAVQRLAGHPGVTTDVARRALQRYKQQAQRP